ncbi:MAG: response regulator [Dissulfurispiraceae bacterium]|jgi:CheY-like chemotaxis protein
MDEIIKWLTGIEREAWGLYLAAAKHFKDNIKLSQFLTCIAEDEEWHYEVMKSAAEVFGTSTTPIPSGITVDAITKAKTEKPLLLCTENLSNGSLTAGEMLECVVSAEFSEWNDIFLYVINALKMENHEILTEAPKMQAHKRKIELFIHSSPDGDKYNEMIRRLPTSWKANILVVDDDPSIVRFLSAVLEEDGVVQTAENGLVALNKISEQYFDVILTDIKMPVMNGMDFYTNAVAKDRGIGKRCVFFSGIVDEQIASFVKHNKLTYLVKPLPIDEIRLKVKKILEESSGN